MRSLPPRNIGILFDWHAERTDGTEVHLDRPFDITGDKRLVYAPGELAELVIETATALIAAGVRKGDRIAVIKRNHFDVLIVAAAAARIGALAATISSANRIDHVDQILGKLRPAVILLDGDFLTVAQLADVDLTLHGRTVVIGPEPIGDFPRLEDLRGGPSPSVDLRPDAEPMMITHTSGTTSTPKLVVHSADTNRAAARLELLPLPLATSGHRDVYMSSISFAHSRAYTWAAAQFMLSPQRLVVASSHDVADVEGVLEHHQVTMLEATPNVFQHWLPLVNRRPELFAQVRYFMNTFDMMHPHIARPFVNASRRRAVVWAHSWGQSEVGPIAGRAHSRRHLNRIAGTVNDHMNRLGPAWPGLVQARVLDPDTGKRQRSGELGVIFVRTKSQCLDYLGDTDRHTAKQHGSWWNTGDVGYTDRFGRINFVDRAVDAIPGASATAIESVLLQRIPDVSEVVLLSRGDRPPIPVISVSSGRIESELWTRVTRDLPELATPVIVAWDDLPRTSTWKVRRKELRELVFTETADDTVLEERFI